MGGENEILNYGTAFGKAYESFLKRMENGDFIHHNEQEIRCYLFSEYMEYLQENDFPMPYCLFIDYKVNNKMIDMAIPIEEGEVEKIIAIEIKYDPSPSGVEEDLAKIKELIEKGVASRGFFITLALGDYGLKERLEESGVFSKFELTSEGEGNRGFVEWRSFMRPYDSKIVDSLCIILRK